MLVIAAFFFDGQISTLASAAPDMPIWSG